MSLLKFEAQITLECEKCFDFDALIILITEEAASSQFYARSEPGTGAGDKEGKYFRRFC